MTWAKLDSRMLTLTPAAELPGNWVKLDSRYLTLTPAAELPGNWVKLATRMLTLTPAAELPGNWVKLATRILTLTPAAAPPPTGNWVKLASRTITLSPPGVPPPPPPPGTANLTGKVTDSITGKPIAGVVVDVEPGYRSETDSNGNYQFLNIPARLYNLTFSKSGYQAKSMPSADIKAGNNTINVALVPVGVPPPEEEEKGIGVLPIVAVAGGILLVAIAAGTGKKV